MAKEYKYTTTFASNLHILVNEEKDKFLSLASSELLKDLIPDSVKGEKNKDLLPIAAPLANVCRANANGDLMDSDTAFNVYKQFILRPINLSHNRKTTCGTIINAGFSEFLTDKPLTEDQAKKKDVFNICIAGVIYKVVNPNLIEFLEESSDPSSDKYGQAQLSWEIGFTGQKILLGSKYISEGKVLSSEEDIQKYEKYLQCNGGKGKDSDGNEVYRIVAGDVIPLGCALTSSPAAKLSNVFVEPDNQQDTESPEDENNDKNEESESKIKNNKDNNLKVDKNNKDKEILRVNPIKAEKKKVYMKFKNIKDITDESLKECAASAVVDFIENSIEEANKKWKEQVSQKENEVKTATDKFESLSKQNEQTVKDLEAVKKEVETFKAQAAEAAKLEKYNQRMAYMADTYDLSDEDRKVVMAQIKDIEDEAFAALQKTYEVLLKEKNKAHKAAIAKEQNDKLEKEKKDKEAAASQNNKENRDTKESKASVADAVNKAIDNADKDKNGLPNASDASTESFLDKYKEAFSVENCIVDTRRKNV